MSPRAFKARRYRLAVGTGSPASAASSATPFSPLEIATRRSRFRRSRFANARAVLHNVGFSSVPMRAIISNRLTIYHRIYINAVVADGGSEAVREGALRGDRPREVQSIRRLGYHRIYINAVVAGVGVEGAG